MKTNIKNITGNWTKGYALDKHTLSSDFLGHNEYGHPVFDTTRSEAGEAVYQLKYKQDWSQVEPLADALVKNITPRFHQIDLVIPVPASKPRTRQPVYEISKLVAKILNAKYFQDIIISQNTGPALKDLPSKAEKVSALDGRFTLNQAAITNKGKWNILIVDDLYDTGATLEAVCEILESYDKIQNIYVAILTWK